MQKERDARWPHDSTASLYQTREHARQVAKVIREDGYRTRVRKTTMFDQGWVVDFTKREMPK